MNSKRGSSAVFLMVILAALISIVMALIYGVRRESVSSRVDAVVSLAGDSILSEFDYDIQKEYGLFMIKGTDRELRAKLIRYVTCSLKDMKDVNTEGISASASRFSTANTDLIKDQILEYMKLAAAEDSFTQGDDGTEEDDGRKEHELRSLEHGPTSVSLPSVAFPDKSLTDMAESISGKIGEAHKAFDEGTGAYLLNRYILMHFNSRSEAAHPGHFFANEVEYILAGELSDRRNEKRVEMALKAMRFILNLEHIYGDREKNAAVAAMAEIMTPGAAAAATQAALASTWAYAEADNDIELLWQGHKVPLLKDRGSWAINLDSAIEGLLGGTVVPDEDKGCDYGQYLQILLFFKDENRRIGRVLDLIQINMRAAYDGDFLISEYALGLDARVRVNGREYGYEKKY